MTADTGIKECFNILILDATRNDRNQLKTALGSSFPDSKITFHEAETEAEGFQAISAHAYDWIFLDLALPVCGGIHFLRSIYDADTNACPAPVIALAWDPDMETLQNALRAGAQEYVLKGHIDSPCLQLAMFKAREMYDLRRSSRRAEDELHQARKLEAVGRLTSGVAHDFNNLLTVVVGNIHMLRRRIMAGAEKYTIEDLLAKVSAIEDVSEKGADLVKRLMMFTRQSPLLQEEVDISEAIVETAGLLERTLGDAIEMRTVLAKESWSCLLDPLEFQNILINFALNARDAMPNGGKLTIETENVYLDETYTLSHPNVARGPYVMIAISDTGIGMAPDVVAKVFEPFFTTKGPGEGTGLGMSMAYGFVKQSGGYLNVYSEPGLGSVFRIYLPRYNADSAQIPAALPPTAERRQETILIADDDEDIRVMASSMLEKLGYKTLQAENGLVALEILRRDHRNIDLLFTDIVMPGDMNGVQLAHEVARHYPDIPVLFTSGYTENAIPNYELREGEAMISKPFRRDVLAEKIRTLLDKGQEHGEHKRACAGSR